MVAEAFELPPPERSMDDVLAGVIRFTLGGRPFSMAVLPIGPHDRWQDKLDADMAGSFAAVPARGPKVVTALTDAFRSNRDRMLDALIDYDKDGELPPRDEIREIATQQDIILAIREVRAVGGDPLAASALSAMAGNRLMRRHGLTPVSGRLNGSPSPMGGRRRKSAKP